MENSYDCDYAYQYVYQNYINTDIDLAHILADLRCSSQNLSKGEVIMKAKKITAHTPSIIAIRYLIRHYTVKEHRDGTFTVYLYLPRDSQMTVYKRVTPRRLVDMMYVFDMKGYIMDPIEEE